MDLLNFTQVWGGVLATFRLLGLRAKSATSLNTMGTISAVAYPLLGGAATIYDTVGAVNAVNQKAPDASIMVMNPLLDIAAAGVGVWMLRGGNSVAKIAAAGLGAVSAHGVALGVEDVLHGLHVLPKALPQGQLLGN